MASAAPLVPQRTFFKRPLPTSCTAFASPEGKALFAKALAEGNLESYFTLAPQMVTQNEPAFCALGTLVQILNALGVDPQRRWKSGWRWYDQDMLDCCRPLSDVAAVGLTMSEFACLSLCNGLRAVVHTPLLDPAGRAARRDEGLAQFREDLRTTSRGKGVIALSYSRKTLGQTGDGHFSPIGGWCEEEDMVLVLDVARFKYPSYWIPVSLAYDAMLPIDKATGQPRGYVVLDVAGNEPGSLDAPLSQTTVTLNKSTWASLNGSLSRLLLQSAKDTPTAAELINTLLSHLALTLPTSPIAGRASAAESLPLLLDSLSTTRLASTTPFASSPDPSAVLLNLTFLLALLSPRSALTALVPPLAAEELSALADEALARVEGLREEVDNAARQLGALGECCRSEEDNGAACGCARPGKGVKGLEGDAVPARGGGGKA
ncbi:glutathione gamma-glutamylcysteinyltransferase [Rhodotorula diobovata]|uniref:glutathione gamma-glutamylcysteinyltransferase n=1 Tax=Rhodotorula diobovata TaxID=5288 RepID=A0A5C5FVK8_9BASI|nr:glutathione gamma-glutamylcysteinyltransferase [Rhodotorula diobovata]